MVILKTPDLTIRFASFTKTGKNGSFGALFSAVPCDKEDWQVCKECFNGKTSLEKVLLSDGDKQEILLNVRITGRLSQTVSLSCDDIEDYS